jgi:hypothetical protein
MTSPRIARVEGRPALLLGAFEITELGYAATEFFVSGTATSYRQNSDLGSDGEWSVAPVAEADFVPRLVVLKPADSAKFNGSVIVEWLNVTGGIDAPAEWFMAHREIIRAGYIYIAASVQRVGIEGGLSRGRNMSLKATHPQRYSRLNHPGDAFSFDIFSQVGQLIRSTHDNGILEALSPMSILAVGESQSAMFLTTYVNAIDPLAQVYDGFLIHSRFASAAPLNGSSIFEPASIQMPEAPQFRADLRVPLVNVITETDLIGGPRLGYYRARQPDNDRLRTWEISGTAHADNYTVQVGRIDTGFAPLAEIVAAYAPTTKLLGAELSRPINFAPQHHYVIQAAFAALHDWVSSGRAAPRGTRMLLNEAVPPQLLLDGNGLAKGGIRTPWVDVPTALTSGVGSDQGGMASLFGTGAPFDAPTLQRLYPGGADEYLARFEESLDSTIKSGFILPADRQEILELAAATFPR